MNNLFPELTEANVNSNYPLRKMKELNTYVLENVDKKVKYDVKKHFNNDVICYLDFSDPIYLANDLSGNQYHGKNLGVSHSSERTNSANFIHRTRTGETVIYDSVRHLDMDVVADKIHANTYSVSFWFKENTSSLNSILSFCNTNTASDTYVGIFTTASNRLAIYERRNTTLTLSLTSEVLVSTNWHFVVFTNTPSGHSLYIDNVLTTPTYASGTTSSRNVDLSTMQPNKFTIGAVAENLTGKKGVGERYSYGYQGLVSDVMVHNRVLTTSEIDKMFNNDYGYDLIMLCGQSNQVGKGTIVSGLDDDYTLHENRVLQYETDTNIDFTTSPYNYKNPTNIFSGAINPLKHQNGIVAGTMGLWKSFVDDYIRYSGIPFRKSIVVVPLGSDGTSLLSHWNPSGRCFITTQRALNQMTNSLINPVGDSKMYKITTLIWTQGETDAQVLNLNYKSQFMDMYNGFKNTITGFDDEVVVLVSEMSAQYDTTISNATIPPTYMKPFINKCLQEIVAENKNFGFITTLDLQYANDYIHYINDSLRIMGHRFFKEFMRVSNQYDKKNGVEPRTTDLYLKPIQTINWTNEPLTHYGKRTVVYTLNRVSGTGGANSISLVIDYVRIGSILIATIQNVPAFSVGNADTQYITVDNAIPFDLRPNKDTVINNVVFEGVNTTNGYYYFDSTTGTILARSGINTNGLFTASLSYAIHPCSACFTLVDGDF